MFAIIGVLYNWVGLCTKSGFGTEKLEKNLLLKPGVRYNRA
jgi:hypothetical protein